MKPRWRRFVGPMALLVLAVGVAVLPFYWPSPNIDAGPVDLGRGATRTFTFHAPFTLPYDIGLQMDQAAAMRLAPCTANVDWYSAHEALCRKVPRALRPDDFQLALNENNREFSGQMWASNALAGGRYGGKEIYTWLVAGARLERGHQYTVKFKTLVDAAWLRPAQPHLEPDPVILKRIRSWRGSWRTLWA
jgi:hypothetical protein